MGQRVTDQQGLQAVLPPVRVGGRGAVPGRNGQLSALAAFTHAGCRWIRLRATRMRLGELVALGLLMARGKPLLPLEQFRHCIQGGHRGYIQVAEFLEEGVALGQEGKLDRFLGGTLTAP
jgi:hypothetical protein